jgi:hypothetical protein
MPGLGFEGNEGEDARWRETKWIFRMTIFIGLIVEVTKNI